MASCVCLPSSFSALPSHVQSLAALSSDAFLSGFKSSSSPARSLPSGVIFCKDGEVNRLYSFKGKGDNNAKLQKAQQKREATINRRETLFRSSSVSLLAAIFHFSGTRPTYLGVQKNPPSLALCPATSNCISTSEEFNDPGHYVPPWTYNPEDGRGRTEPVSREHAMKELLDVIKSNKPDNFNPMIVEQRDDYIHVEYESPFLGFIDDVEFWFPPGNRSLVEYRSASRMGQFDFDKNRNRIKALRQALEKKGWQSVGF